MLPAVLAVKVSREAAVLRLPAPVDPLRPVARDKALPEAVARMWRAALAVVLPESAVRTQVHQTRHLLLLDGVATGSSPRDR